MIRTGRGRYAEAECPLCEWVATRKDPRRLSRLAAKHQEDEHPELFVKENA